ncbi:unnamed protein product [Danaus chrysippus]|uniref:(African queen) hypothetical protein n=1 Tax=Danaus chrysippus TaxID=151541 RepID=A0A8J2QYR2_9NEOP|nr:unnamed protein product [Danaus chrysippus]
MLKAGNSFALGLSNSIAIVLFTEHASCTRPLVVAVGRTLAARPPRAVTSPRSLLSLAPPARDREAYTSPQ